MIAVRDEGDGVVTLLPPAAPPPVLAAPPPPVVLAPPPVAAPASGPAKASQVNAAGETLEAAKAAILAEVAAGASPPAALERHPLPAGSVTASEALDFLASLPQSTTPFADPAASTVTGPPLATLPGYDPVTHTVASPPANAPAAPSVDVGGTSGDGRGLESAYRPPGVVAQWRNIVDLFRVKVPRSHAQVKAANQALLGVFK